MYDTLPPELRMRALCLPATVGELVGEPPEAPLERIRWAIDKDGLPAALKQITETELNACWLMYTSLQLRKQEQEQVRVLSRRIKLARKLQSLLPYPLPDLDAIIALDEWLLNPKGDPPLEGLPPIESLPPIAAAAAITSIRATKVLQGKKFGKPLDQLSAFEVVAGWIIPGIWECHCGSAAGYTRNDADDSIRGKFVDFAEIVLAVLGITKSDGALYERRSIAEALTKCRRLRNQ
jgi:hypothetical protein